MKYRIKEIIVNETNIYYLIYFRFLFFFWLPKRVDIYDQPYSIKRTILKITDKKGIEKFINYFEKQKTWIYKNILIKKVYYPYEKTFGYAFEYENQLLLSETIDDAYFKIDRFKPSKKSKWIEINKFSSDV
jgi:hypothetical protein